MNSWWTAMVPVALGLVLIWLALVAVLFFQGRRYDDPARLRDVLRLIPDVVRLLRRLSADHSLPRGVRIRLVLLLAYLASPIDLVPDFIPLIGYADDAIIVALTLRSIARTAGPDAIDRHWTGTTDGLLAIKRLTGLSLREDHDC